VSGPDDASTRDGVYGAPVTFLDGDPWGVTEIDVEDFTGILDRYGKLEIADVHYSPGPRGTILRGFTLIVRSTYPVNRSSGPFEFGNVEPTVVHRHDLCAIAQVNGAWPRLVVRRRRGSGAPGDPDRFHHDYEVSSPTTKLSDSLLTPDLTAFIAAVGGAAEYHFDGKWLLVRAPAGGPLPDRPVIEVLRGVVARLPLALYTRYPSPWADERGRPLREADDLEARRQGRVDLDRLRRMRPPPV
jgi:hypothetical protein